MKRRTEIGSFKLLQSSDDHALFAKLDPGILSEKTRRGSPGDLVQYQFWLMADKVVIDLHMESESGQFFPFRTVDGGGSNFHRMLHNLKERDQTCGRALASRTNLLRVFQSDEAAMSVEESHVTSANRILAYSSRESRKLQFFSGAGAANSVLFQITESLLLSDSLGARVAKLGIDPNSSIRDEDAGIWLVLQFDRDTMSLVHLSLVDKSGAIGECDACTYRELTFFTIGLTDLYSKRDDVVDDDSTDSHISDYLCVSEFADLVDVAHKENFAAAAYIALRTNVPPEGERFERSDFTEVLSVCEFVEVASVIVSGVSHAAETETLSEEQSKLSLVIGAILRPVEGDSHCFYYFGHGVEEEMLGNESDSLSTSSVDEESATSVENGIADSDEEADHEGPEESHRGEDIRSMESLSHKTFAEGSSFLVNPPIFVRFTLDGEPASIQDLYSIKKSTNLAAQMSVFKSRKSLSEGNIYDSQLPLTHHAVALELRTLLKSYVAEQTIERLRQFGPSVSDDELLLVKKCLKRVRSVVSFSIEVYFYVAKIDTMVPATAPAGGEAEVEEGFQILHGEIRKNGSFPMKVVPGGFVVAATKEDAIMGLEFWCFVKIGTSEGVIFSQIYHPDGEEEALKVMTRVHDAMMACVHRVNQQLLLKGYATGQWSDVQHILAETNNELLIASLV
jgi:hypothetical protein